MLKRTTEVIKHRNGGDLSTFVKAPGRTDFDAITMALREAIRRSCSGAQFEGEFPRHVWGWLNGQLYEARLINRAQGWYKAWPIEDAERPTDDEGRLNW